MRGFEVIFGVREVQKVIFRVLGGPNLEGLAREVDFGPKGSFLAPKGHFWPKTIAHLTPILDFGFLEGLFRDEIS